MIFIFSFLFFLLLVFFLVSALCNNKKNERIKKRRENFSLVCSSFCLAQRERAKFQRYIVVNEISNGDDSLLNWMQAVEASLLLVSIFSFLFISDNKKKIQTYLKLCIVLNQRNTDDSNSEMSLFFYNANTMTIKRSTQELKINAKCFIFRQKKWNLTF